MDMMVEKSYRNDTLLLELIYNIKQLPLKKPF